jgi:dipeptidase D
MPDLAIEGLVPKSLWDRFYEISQIPRPSKHEDRIRMYLRDFGDNNNLQTREDAVGNILIQVPATSGFENAPPVALQGHIDMVCEKNRDIIHDFFNDPIKLVRDGDWIKADGTTLGADNGIGAAAALAVVGDDSFEHGPLELLFTVDEETGLTGANNLRPGFLKSKLLLNLDTEEDGAFYIGCSGGMDTAGSYKLETEKIKSGFIQFVIFISRLKGGHSGLEINAGRSNAIKLLGILLDKLAPFEYQLAFIQGGSKRNAIPREAEARIFMNPEYESNAREIINEFSIETVLEYRQSDSEIKVTFERKENDTPNPKEAFKKHLTEKIIQAIYALPHGVISMSQDIPHLVETSANLATIQINNSEIEIGTSQRSSIESAKKNIGRAVNAVFELSGAAVKVTDGYPGWQPNIDSKLLKISSKVFRRLFGKKPDVKAVHAGLECGILSEKYPGIDMISFGPTIIGAHSPEEKVNIPDVEKFYSLLKSILTELTKL